MQLFTTSVFKKVFHKLTSILLFSFPYAIVLSYLFLVIEAFTYAGFLQKRILVSSALFSSLTLIVGSFLLLRSLLAAKNIPKILDYAFIINRLLVPATVFLYFLFTLEEKRHFPNYVFSRYHLNPDQFKFILIFNFGLLVIDLSRFYLKRILEFFEKNRKRQSLESYIFVIIVYEVLLVGMPTFIGVSRVAVFDVGYVATHFFDTYDQRQERALSDYAYFAFIRDHTPSDAIVNLPPQKSPWLTSGNEGYVRYFLFPRKIVKSADKNVVDPSADYIIIDRGEWAVPDPNDYGWPRTVVNAQKIWYFDRATKEVTESDEKVFDPSNPNQKLRWGLIQVKKE